MIELNLKKVEYQNLNPKQQEIYNFQKVAAMLADYGFNCIKLADDWQGADFLAYHKNGSDTLRVQLKGRICINKKYIDKNLFIIFPVRESEKIRHDSWYLIEHKKLISLIEEHTNWLDTSTWRNKGKYSAKKPNEQLLLALEKSRL